MAGAVAGSYDGARVLTPGQVFGNYRIVRQLDAGGMGTVYEAEHTHLGVRCALKMFSPASQQREFLRKRFLVEGKVLASFRHPRIVRVTDLGVDEVLQTPYFVMDLVLSPEGEPMTLEDRRRRGVTEEEAVRWFRDACEGLAYIHSKGVVHRDISLENIMVGADGHAVITDFGIARLLDADLRRRVELTRFTMVEVGQAELRMGKVPYMAPELLRPMPAVATPESDAWALGVAMFRLLTGFWFECDHRENSLMMLEGLEYNWSSVLGRLLSLEPKGRLPEGGIGELTGSLAVGRVRREAPRWLRPAVAAICVGLAAIAGTVVVRRETPRPPLLEHDTIVSFLSGDDESVTNAVSEAFVAVWFDAGAADPQQIAEIKNFLEMECLDPFVEALFENRTTPEILKMVEDSDLLLSKFRLFVGGVLEERNRNAPDEVIQLDIGGIRLAVW